MMASKMIAKNHSRQAGELEKTPVELMGGMHVMRHDAGVAGFLMGN